MTIDTSARVGPLDHVVMFYDNDVDLVRAVAEHAIAGFVAGEATIAVATTRHIAAFEAAMVDRGVDVAGARADGAWTAVDASHAMSRFIVDDRPDPDAFDAEIGRLVRDATAGGRTARVYGEMVALLWDDGHVGAAIELESLWNALRVEVEFTLLCAYASHSVSGDHHNDSFQQLCQAHSCVVGDVAARADASRSFDYGSESLSEARQFVGDMLRAWNLERCVEDGAIIVSELATNALIHGGSEFTVRATSLDGRVRVSVRDSSVAVPVMQSPLPTTVSGRGLILISGVAEAWGSDPVDGGKIVWADLRH